MARMKRNSEETKSGEQFTSMIDIVFLLLVFFLVLPFKQPDFKLDNELPKDKGDGGPTINDDIEPVRIKVKGKGDKVRYAVDGRDLSGDYRLLSRAVRAAANDSLDLVRVVIDADDDVFFNHVLRAYDQCLVAGAKKVTYNIPKPTRKAHGAGAFVYP